MVLPFLALVFVTATAVGAIRGVEEAAKEELRKR